MATRCLQTSRLLKNNLIFAGMAGFIFQNLKNMKGGAAEVQKYVTAIT